MRSVCVSWVGWLVVAALTACDGARFGQDPGVGNGADGSPIRDGGPGMSPPAEDAAGKGDRDLVAAADTLMPVDAEPEPPQPVREPRAEAGPFGNGVAPPVLLVPGDVRLVGEGRSSCSYQVPASNDGHRWCAFMRTTQKPEGELWVIDITAAASGPVPACDGSSDACVRLTTHLWLGPGYYGPFAPYAHHFDGDTLIFYASATSLPDHNHRGPIFAWRPGWRTPRRISTAEGFFCTGHERVPVAFCANNAVGEKFDLVDFELHAGPLVDSEFTEMINLGRVSASGTRFDFSNDGKHFVLSSADLLTGEQLVRIIATDKIRDELPHIMLVGGRNWRISHDDRSIYFMGPGGPFTDEITIADFPTGTNIRPSGVNARRFVLLGSGNQGLDEGAGIFARLDDGKTVFRALPDRTHADQAVTVFSYNEPIEDFHLTEDTRYVGYAHFASTGGFNGYLARLDGSGECQLSDNPRAPAMEFDVPEKSNVVFWMEMNEETGIFGGFISDTRTCTKQQRFADNLAFHRVIAGHALVFGENPEDDYSFTLMYMPVNENGAAGASVRVFDWVDYPLALVDQPGETAVFAARTVAESRRGLYLFRMPPPQ